MPGLLVLVMLLASYAEASPLRLDYSKSWSANGIVYYTFTLALENADESWVPGMGWGWLIFGDSPTLGGSEFADFTLTGGSMRPWTSVTTSAGAHNGPTLGPVGDFWVPSNVGEFLTWQGYSTSNIADGELFFSTFFTTGGAVGADFQLANNLFPDADFPNSPAFAAPKGSAPASSASPPSGSSSSSSSSSGGGLNIQTVATPEPGTVGLAGLALVALAWRRRRE
ncbi:MAG: PEP-CTERM sorting domain-containing protein [Bryobacteraceae bacterium]|nr:PEP-CTERM sorting domain-containing protein [Bryobacteraceae bacterium]